MTPEQRAEKLANKIVAVQAAFIAAEIADAEKAVRDEESIWFREGMDVQKRMCAQHKAEAFEECEKTLIVSVADAQREGWIKGMEDAAKIAIKYVSEDCLCAEIISEVIRAKAKELK